MRVRCAKRLQNIYSTPMCVENAFPNGIDQFEYFVINWISSSEERAILNGRTRVSNQKRDGSRSRLEDPRCHSHPVCSVQRIVNLHSTDLPLLIDRRMK